MKKITNIALIFLFSFLFFACGETNSDKNENLSNKNSIETNSNLEQANVSIKTNYHDLPDNQAEKLAKILNAESLEMLNAQNLEVQKEYLLKYLFGTQNPLNNLFTTNYFWFIYNALPNFVSENERHSGYYTNENQQPSDEKLLAYSIYRIDRSPENLQKIFDFAKPNLKKIVTEQMYFDNGMDIKINSLMTTYEQIAEIEDYKKLLTDAYNHTDTATGYFYEGENGKQVFELFNDAYGKAHYSVSEIICQHLGLDRYSILYGSYEASFWMRRNHEGNMQKVYEILSEIQKTYQPDDESY